MLLYMCIDVGQRSAQQADGAAARADVTAETVQTAAHSPHSPHSPTHGPTGAGSSPGTPWSLELGHGEGQIASQAPESSEVVWVFVNSKQRAI